MRRNDGYRSNRRLGRRRTRLMMMMRRRGKRKKSRWKDEAEE